MEVEVEEEERRKKKNKNEKIDICNLLPIVCFIFGFVLLFK